MAPRKGVQKACCLCVVSLSGAATACCNDACPARRTRVISDCRLTQGLDVHNTNGQGHNALHKAAYGGHRAICEWLQDGPPHLDPEALLPDARGQTPADLAVKAGFQILALWLARHRGAGDGKGPPSSPAP